MKVHSYGVRVFLNRSVSYLACFIDLMIIYFRPIAADVITLTFCTWPDKGAGQPGSCPGREPVKGEETSLE
jgi:hypothetical protein